MAQFDAAWLADQRARADVLPLKARVPLMAGQDVIGSVLPDLFDKIGQWPTNNVHSLLSKVKHSAGANVAMAWGVSGRVTPSLAQLAHALRDANVGHVAHHWRNEQLAVHGERGQRLGDVERGVVRTLGIRTRAVHLVGFAQDGRLWVQQRALNKANDPGLWDTLMGGMVASSDSVQTALVRETWEEAGLYLDQLKDVLHGGGIAIRRPTGEADDDGTGYVIEDTDWYRCTVPDGLIPVNQDGEVEQFLLLDRTELMARLQRNEFTLEAALILAAAITD